MNSRLEATNAAEVEERFHLAVGVKEVIAGMGVAVEDAVQEEAGEARSEDDLAGAILGRLIEAVVTKSLEAHRVDEFGRQDATASSGPRSRAECEPSGSGRKELPERLRFRASSSDVIAFVEDARAEARRRARPRRSASPNVLILVMKPIVERSLARNLLSMPGYCTLTATTSPRTRSRDALVRSTPPQTVSRRTSRRRLRALLRARRE